MWDKSEASSALLCVCVWCVCVHVGEGASRFYTKVGVARRVACSSLEVDSRIRCAPGAGTTFSR